MKYLARNIDNIDNESKVGVERAIFTIACTLRTRIKYPESIKLMRFHIALSKYRKYF